MGLLDWLRRNKKEEAETVLEERPREEIRVIPEEDALDLGWYWSENKDEMQMAKIKEKDRHTHLYVVGASGAGKSKFLEFLIRQDILKGKGFGLIDPHGDLVEEIKGFLASVLPKEETEERVVHVDPASEEYTIAFNPLEKTEGLSPAEISAELIEAFKKIWHDSWGARMEDLLRNTLIALIKAELTLVDLPQFLINEDFRLN